MSILAPLAERMRPMSLNEFQGQDHLLKEDASIRRAINSGLIPSMIFWGPPGVGKTTLAHLIANHLKRQFFTLSAISSGVKDVREVIHKVESAGMFQQSGAILFIDEIHRFSKAQQDSLLGAVEKGIVTLIGATTENPSFEVISALLSRCQVYTLKEHSKESLLAILNKAITEDSLLQSKNIELKETNALLMISGGDARKLLNIFELIVGTFKDEDIIITDELVKEATQERVVNYDKDGDQHYDIISAFIKSIRGSDPNAAIYWLARMVEGGEDPKFIARRLIISASEDVGLANPNALLMANNCFNAIQAVGWPEARIILAQCVIYLAASPKGNAAYKAINEAQSRVRETGSLGIPLSLRNAPSKLMKELGYGDGYRYSHDYPENFADQEFLPDEIIGTSFYSAGSSTKEKEVQEKINKLWGAKYSK
jgi:putative ATPase